MKKTVLFIAVLFLTVVFQGAARAYEKERIESFNSRITVNPDSTLRVTETIRVFAVGDKIKRGIYRDFPTRCQNPLGFQYYVGFDVESVTRDGENEPFFTKDIDNGVRVYMGSEDYYLPNYKSYTYRLTYRTDRQLYFTTNYTELYWNVTGNEWDFNIEEASADIILPDGAKPFFVEAYTGPRGSTATNYRVTRDKNGIHVRSTVPLAGGEGLTVLVRWPSGFVTEPVQQSRMNEIIRYNKGEFVGIAGLLLVLLYYFIAWVAVGRDPKKGVIMPLYESPDGLSPAALRYIRKMGFDTEAMAATVVNMAVKGVLKIVEESDGDFQVKKVSDNISALTEEEKKLFETFFSGKETFVFKQSNYTHVSAAVELLKGSLKKSYNKKYFVSNGGYFAFGVLLTIGAVAASYIVSGIKQGPGFFLLIWLTFWTLGVVPLLVMVVTSWRSVGRSKSGKKGLLNAGGALFMTLFSIPFLAAEVIVGGLYLKEYSPWMMVIVLATIVLNSLFYYLLKAPTAEGRKLMDRIEGFRRFLAATEQDKLGRMMPIDRNMVNYEKFLPYAIALDVEEKWTGQFKEALESAQVTKSSPSWYSGSSWTTLGAMGFAHSLGSSFTSAISTSSVSRSSGGGSGGGGGSSGGGGGGGGGGGW